MITHIIINCTLFLGATIGYIVALKTKQAIKTACIKRLYLILPSSSPSEFVSLQHFLQHYKNLKTLTPLTLLIIEMIINIAAVTQQPIAPDLLIPIIPNPAPSIIKHP